MALVKRIRKTYVIRTRNRGERARTTGTGSASEKIVDNEINITYVCRVARTRVVAIVGLWGWLAAAVGGGTADRQACARQRKRF